MQHPPSDPYTLFQNWFGEAPKVQGEGAEAVALASANENGRPSVRYVFYRGLKDGAFTFYTNYDSRKNREFSQNPWASMLFYWPEQKRQVRIEGSVTGMTREDSTAYFRRRARGSQIGAWASHQSKEIESRAALEQRFKHYENQFQGQEIPLPDWWGGWLLTPDHFEFWASKPNRLHHRQVFRAHGKSWKTALLSP